MLSIRQRRRAQTARHALAPLRRNLELCDHLSRSAYIERFRDSYRGVRRRLSSAQLFEQVRYSDHLLIGDFHCCPYYQEFVCTLLRDLSSRDAERPRVLAIEFAYANQQPIFDEWQTGEISDHELRTRLRFDEQWGFSWRSYFALLNTARELGVRLIAADCPLRGSMRRINARDRHFAQKLSEQRTASPGTQVIALIGESHLAPTHLPLQLKSISDESDRIVVLLQNVDELHWHRGGDVGSAVQMDDDVFAVSTCSPFEKYESYRRQFGRWTNPALRRQSTAQRAYDLIDSALSILRIEQYADEEGEREPKYLIDFYPEVVDCRIIPISKGRCWYEPDSNRLMVGAWSDHEIATQVGRFIRNACAPVETATSPEQSFYRVAFESALAKLISLLLFPTQRECKEESLFERHSDALEREDIEELVHLEFLVLHRDYERHRKYYAQMPPVLQLGDVHDGSGALAHELGEMLAFDLAHAYFDGVLSRAAVRNLFFKRPPADQWMQTYFELAYKVRRLPRMRSAA